MSVSGACRHGLLPAVLASFEKRSLRRNIMHKRLVWLVPIALATLLTGCSITVTMLGPLAPDSLVGYRLELMNEDKGGPMDANQLFDVKDEVSYLFVAENEVLDLALRNSGGGFVKAVRVSYNSSGDTGKLELTFKRNNDVDINVECTLTFKRSLDGTHRCEFEEKERDSVELRIIKSGWGEGTFELEKP
jgi:hypothetical protein